MAQAGDEARVALWIALGSQPGVSAWHAVWLLSRLMPPLLRERPKAEPAAPMSPRTRRVRAGTQPYREQPRP